MKNKIINRFLSLISSLLLFLFSISGIMDFVHVDLVTEYSVLCCFVSILYLVAAVLLLLDFCDLKMVLVKKRIWIPVVFVGLAMRIFPFVLVVVISFFRSLYDFCLSGGSFY